MDFFDRVFSDFTWHPQEGRGSSVRPPARWKIVVCGITAALDLWVLGSELAQIAEKGEAEPWRKRR